MKTGTSSGFRDGWTVGYTRERTVAVWVGNADGRPMRELSGAAGAGPLFADVMRTAMKGVGQRAELFDRGELRPARVCPLSGKLAGLSCPDHATREFPKTHLPTEACDVHVRASRVGAGLGARFRCDRRGAEVVAVFPDAFDDWLAGLPIGAPGEDAHGTPWLSRSATPGCGASRGAGPRIHIDSPAAGSVFLFSRGAPSEHQRIDVRASVSGVSHRDRPAAIEFVVDGEVVGRSAFPYRASLAVPPGDHRIEARPADPALPVRAARITLSVR